MGNMNNLPFNLFVEWVNQKKNVYFMVATHLEEFESGILKGYV